MEEAYRDKVEKRLDALLKNGKIRDIKREVNPRNLTKCRTNCLMKALKVSEKLHARAMNKGPESHEIEKLAKYVDSFSCALLERFEEDEEMRCMLKDHSLDMLIENAIESNQKKFLSHAVIFDFLKKKWYGSFFHMAHASWKTINRWKWLMMCIWCLFDIILFPFIFAFLFLLKVSSRSSRRRQIPATDLEGSQTASNKGTTEQDIALDSFETSVNRITTDQDEEQTGEEVHHLQPKYNERRIIKRAMPIRFFKRTRKHRQSEEVSTKDKDGKKVKRYLLDWYKEYFTTPFFLFLKDSISYLILLSLHFTLCVQAPVVRLTTIEWIILVFFAGRITNEIFQLVKERKGGEITDKGRMLFVLRFRKYLCDHWNIMDLLTILVYLVILVLRLATWIENKGVSENRNLTIANYLYGFNTLLLTFRAFGQILESKKGMGIIQISLLKIIVHVVTIFWQFAAAVLSFSFAITKVFEAERSFNTGRNATKSYCRTVEGMECWWQTAKHLVWSLFGLVELSDFSSQDLTSITIARIMYVLYLVLAVIMLVNMMIALLSNTYQQVQENAIEEWGHKKAITIQTYGNYHPVMAPLNLISLPLYFIIRKCRKSSKVNTRITKEEKKEFDDLVQKELEPSYFAKYGYEFPPNDDDITNEIHQEVTGTRSVTNHIVESLFNPVDNKLPEGDEAWDSDGLQIIGNRLFDSSPKHCKHCQTRTEKDQSEFHGARYLRPLSKDYPMFEVLIQDTGERRLLAIGLVYGFHIAHFLPGWKTPSPGKPTVGYHVDDGKIFDADNPEDGRDIKRAMAYRGNVVGCKVLFDEIQNKALPVVFTLNGREVGTTSMSYDSDDQYFSFVYPYIGIWDEEVSVLFKMCPAEDGYVSATDPFTNGMEEVLRELNEQKIRQKEMVQELKELKDQNASKNDVIQELKEHNAAINSKLEKLIQLVKK